MKYTLFLLVAIISLQKNLLSQNKTADFRERYGEFAKNKKDGDSIRLYQLFDLDWQYTMLEYPEFATAVGYPGQNDRWTDNSLEAIERRNNIRHEEQKAVNSIDRNKLNATDKLCYDLFKKGVNDGITGEKFKGEYMPITQLNGIQQDIASLIAQMPSSNVQDYENIITRLNNVPVVVEQTITLMQKGLETGITPPQITMRDVAQQVQNQIVDDPAKSPMLTAFSKFPESVPTTEQERLKKEAAMAYKNTVVPSFQKFFTFLDKTYIPQCRTTIGMSAMPGGKEWYAYNAQQMTTTNLSPEEIHTLGLSEVKRIHNEMEKIIAQVDFKGTFQEFLNFLRTDPQFFFDKPEDLVKAYRDIAKRADPELVKLFGKLPRLPYGVVPVPAYAEKSQTTAYYQQGSLKGGRAGSYYVNTYDLKSRPKWEMEALSLHESVPGHHLQISLAQELDDVPEFRKYAGYTAFVEGWGLYSESLGDEMGFYKDPYSKFGQLTYEMWRAIRLVVDTGIHSMGWTRQQAINYFLENSAKSEHDVTVEVDRYIVWPGQALAYKIGELKIKELRKYASNELGNKFDIRAFHDKLLGSGALPLDVLEANMREWVTEQKQKIN